jgi:hypothetical protein
MRLGRVLWCGDAASTDAADAIDLALHGSER